MKTYGEMKTGLNRRLNELNAAMSDAMGKRDTAALEAAGGDPGATQALTDLFREMDRIGRERDAVAGALRQLERRHEGDNLQANLATIHSNRDHAVKALEAVPVAFQEFISAAAALKATWEALKTCTQVATTLEAESALLPNGYTFHPSSLSIGPLAEALLWLATGDELEPRLTLSVQTPEQAAAQVSASVARGVKLVLEGAKHRAATLEAAHAVSDPALVHVDRS